ncbi:uncharacterized protein LOC132938116 isoform X2 [Metopolophium dirhodum]|uniref:uncharacterized protein LOC132938116 isoform X2 n=1 Tax=Metopolophium dirhodum TaxID=44670 RepID=UPI00298FAC58|nr:uncharacterized protein LOC132938116 isoform X2 [Metopolophium dirhodum]
MSDDDSKTLAQNDDNNTNDINQQIDTGSDQNVSQNPNDPPNPSPQSSTSNVVNQRRTSLHPLEEVELNRRVKRKRTSSAYGGQPLSAEENNNEENQSQRSPQQSTADNKSTHNISRSSLLYEGYSSVTSIDSRYLDSRRTNEKWKDIVVFMYTEPSIMFYSNIFLMISGVMIISAIFQLGLGITMINRVIDQHTMVKKEMKLSFLSYGIQSDVTQRWNSFQSELSCCGLHGGNSYKSKQLPIPESCYKEQRNLKQYAKINNCHMGCFDKVKKLEEKFLDPVIILTFLCSFLQFQDRSSHTDGLIC